MNLNNTTKQPSFTQVYGDNRKGSHNMVDQKVSTSTPKSSASNKQESNCKLTSNKREIQGSPTNRKKNTMRTSNEDVMKMKTDTLSKAQKKDVRTESTESTVLVRDGVNPMSIRSMMPQFVDYWSDKELDSMALASIRKMLCDMGRFIDIDGNFSAITKLDYVRYTELLRSEGMSSPTIMQRYSWFTEFIEWAEARGAGSAKNNHPKSSYDSVEDYEGLMEHIDALYEKNWRELWNSVMPKELR